MAAAVASGVSRGARGGLLGAFYAAVVLVVLAAGGQHRLRICLRVSDQVGRILVATAVPGARLARLAARDAAYWGWRCGRAGWWPPAVPC